MIATAAEIVIFSSQRFLFAEDLQDHRVEGVSGGFSPLQVRPRATFANSPP